MPLADPTNQGNAPGHGPLRIGGQSMRDLPREGRNLPSTESKVVKGQMPAVLLMRDVWGGNERVKGAAERYLPRAPRELPINYSARLTRSVFVNFTKRAIEGLVGFVFRKDPVLGKDVPARIAAHAENIDNAGTHLDVFARDLMADAMTTGHAAILVDFPNTHGRVLRIDEEAALGVRPYWVPIKKEQIVSFRPTLEDGRLVLEQLVLREESTEPDGLFGEVAVTRFRVFTREVVDGTPRVRFSLQREMPDKRVVVEDFGEYPTQVEIPVAEVPTSGRRALFESDPPLADVAHLNIAHYQIWSDYARSMHMAGVPLLFTKGFGMKDEEGNTIEVGPDSGLNAESEHGDAKYISHDGAALSSMKEALDDLKADIGALGLEMLAPQKRTAETLGAKRLDKSGSDSALSVTARGLQDAIERALGFHARYLGLPSGGSVTINREYEAVVLDAATMQAYAVLADKLGLPDEAILRVLIAGGRLPEDTDIVKTAAAMAGARAAREDVADMESQLTAERPRSAA